MKRIALPLIVILIAGGVALLAVKFAPQPEKRERPKPAPLSVSVETLQSVAFPVEVQSFGKVQPRTSSTLLPQVSGEVIAINDSFRDGGFFEKGEILVTIDDRDYKVQVEIAESNLYEAQLALREEQAKAEQAELDWKRLQRTVPSTPAGANVAPDLVLRKPQLAAASARVKSAKAQLAQAKLDLERTRLVAPYAGRILHKHVDLGQVVSPSTNLADVYAIDYVEVRLPIKNHELQYLSLPESYRFKDKNISLPKVAIENRLGSPTEHWQAKLVRTEGAIDSNSHQLYVIAQLDDPYGTAAHGKRPLKIGQYVHAKIQGTTIKSALVIPNRAIYQDSYVYVVENQELHRKEVSIQWQNSQMAIIEAGLEPGDELVTTPLGQVTSGTPVQTEPQS